jgi:hypothetical protein
MLDVRGAGTMTRLGLGVAPDATYLCYSSGTSPQFVFNDTTASTGMKMSLASTGGFAGWSANRDFVAGTIFDTGKCAASYYCFVGNGNSYHGWNVHTTNNTAPVEKLRLTGVGNLKIGGGFGPASRGTTEGTNHLDIFDGTAPVGTLTNGVSLYSASGKLKSADAAGTIGHILSASSVNSVSPTAPNRTLTVDIGGTTYYIAAKTTND